MGIFFNSGTGAVRGCGSAPRSRAFGDGAAAGAWGLAAVIAELAKSIAMVDPNSMLSGSCEQASRSFRLGAGRLQMK
jgi:hypothetical protein